MFGESSVRHISLARGQMMWFPYSILWRTWMELDNINNFWVKNMYVSWYEKMMSERKDQLQPTSKIEIMFPKTNSSHLKIGGTPGRIPEIPNLGFPTIFRCENVRKLRDGMFFKVSNPSIDFLELLYLGFVESFSGDESFMDSIRYAWDEVFTMKLHHQFGENMCWVTCSKHRTVAHLGEMGPILEGSLMLRYVLLFPSIEHANPSDCLHDPCLQS